MGTLLLVFRLLVEGDRGEANAAGHHANHHDLAHPIQNIENTIFLRAQVPRVQRNEHDAGDLEGQRPQAVDNDMDKIRGLCFVFGFDFLYQWL